MKQSQDWKKTKFTELLGIEYPIVQGPFGGGLSSSNLAATVSNLGGLGSFGAHYLSPEGIVAMRNEIGAKTSKAFALNLWVSNKDEGAENYSMTEFARLCKLYEPYFKQLSIPLPEKPAPVGSQFEEQVPAILESRPPVFSFVFGIPSADILEQCRAKGIKTIGTATTVEEAVALDEAGVDAIVATGFEAGGHRVSFMRSPEASLTGAFALIPQVADKVKAPVIAAGGIADGRGITAALALGADAVQIGTAFLACEESNATHEHKSKLFSNDGNYTVLTKLMTGRLARGMRSQITDDLNNTKDSFAPYPLQRSFTSLLTAAAIKQGKPDLVTFWAGQSTPLLKHRKAADLMKSLVAEMDN